MHVSNPCEEEYLKCICRAENKSSKMLLQREWEPDCFVYTTVKIIYTQKNEWKT